MAHRADNAKLIKSQKMCWVRLVACMGERRNAYRIFVGGLKAVDKLEITGKYVRKIKVSLNIELEVAEWTYLAQDREK